MRAHQAFLHTGGDRAVAELAAGQAATISTAQLHAIGLDRGAIQWRVQQGRLHRVHRGVYVVGVPRLTPRGRLWAAVLACGGPDAAVISHLSAAHMWRIRDGATRRVHVTTLRASHTTAAIQAHRTGLHESDIVTLDDGLRATSVARTLLDISTVLTFDELERACHEAAFRHRRELPRTPPRSRDLRTILARLTDTGPQITRSEAENIFLSLVARLDLPRPLVNVPLLGYTVDFFWPDRKLVVETDGADAHLNPIAFEADRVRDAELSLAGYDVVRFTWRQLVERPTYVERQLRERLSA